MPTFTAVHRLRDATGAPYPANTVDPEDIRVDPRTGHYVWSQEGDRGATPIDPSVREAARDGAFVREYRLADNLRMRPDQGPRRNEALEGPALARGRVVTAVEGPLLRDGPPADRTRGAVSRITTQTPDRVRAQYAYRQEPVFAEGGSTGVTAILPDPRGGRFLVLERSFAPGVGNKVRLFEATTHGATDVAGRSLDRAGPMPKRLLADLADFPLSRVGNVEGMAWGPDRTLVLVSDDNFAATRSPSSSCLPCADTVDGMSTARLLLS
ncbi:esterase-like activity of phytase family protein [Saccharothrix australiensis]|uniref:esterase-like activity of phytase family protein n=1 Tax=Saccharothrix australiensis TaxID=2072 RepID=UPI001FE50087|nr:esterase-like activity of phytase family protein [Saccharothrix australiensis]